MRLASPEEIAAIASQLRGRTGFRIASIPVSFDPFDFARTGAALVDRAVAYSTPWGDRLVGLGTAWYTSSDGPTRFQDVRDAVASLPEPELNVFVGYAFKEGTDLGEPWSDFRPIEAFVPRIGIQQVAGVSRLTVVVPDGESEEPALDLLASMERPEWMPVVDPGDHTMYSHPHIGEWAESVASAVKAIDADELSKVVLARSVTVESTEPVAILRVFRQLVAEYPQCYNFAWKSGDSVFMGASPELLARIEGSSFRSNPLAGSAPRGEGSEEDTRIGEELMASDKDQEEHRIMVDDMRRRLEPVTDRVTIPTDPELKKMATVQHLSTEIEGSLRDGCGVLDVIEAVHPTPAVGGVPRAKAIEFIESVEQIDRGWYTGGIGWVTPSGDGAVAIGLRCGLVRGAATQLFAGAGIVGDSQPDAEVLETRLKLRPLLDIVAAT